MSEHTRRVLILLVCLVGVAIVILGIYSRITS